METGLVPKIIIPWKLPGYNEYINQCRHNKYAGAKVKKETEESICWVMKNYKNTMKQSIQMPCRLKMTFYEQDMRRDYDNVVSAKKFILDAMVSAGLIPNDSRKYIAKIDDDVLVDKIRPRVEIEFYKYEE